MKCNFSARRNRALTLIEVVVVLATAFVVFMVVIPAVMPRRHYHSPRISCASNLKQVGLAFRIWQGDNNDQYPMTATNAPGQLMFSNVVSPVVYFQAMSNELNDPRVLRCPTDEKGTWATNWTSDFHAANLSYFIGVDADDRFPQRILGGDSNLTNGTKVINGMLTVTSNWPAAWTAKWHNCQGNMLMADGSVQQFSNLALKKAFENTGLVTNRLLMP